MKSYAQSALSQRGHEAKDETRYLPLEIVKLSTHLWSRSESRLRCDWLELAGPEAPTLQHLLDSGALQAPQRFIGVDTEAEVIQGCRESYKGAPALWHCGDLIPALRREDAFPDVGVLVFDSHMALKGNRTIRPTLRALSRFAHRQVRKKHEFLLVLNVAGDPRWTNDKDLEKYAAMLTETTGINVSTESFHRYTSKTTPMYWVALRWGF